jgi:hypothetical protein
VSRKEEIKMKMSKLGSALAFCLGAAIVVTGASVSAQPVSSATFVYVSKSNEGIQGWGVPGHEVVLENQDGLDHALEFLNSSNLVYQTTTLSKGQRYDTVTKDGYIFVHCTSHFHPVLSLQIWPS